jgi:hypothetical protein
MSGVIPSLPQYAFMAWCSVKVQGQLYLLHVYTLFLFVLNIQTNIFAIWESNFRELQIEFLCVATPWNVVVGYRRFRGPSYLGGLDLWNVGILPQHYMVSQPKIHRLHYIYKFTYIQKLCISCVELVLCEGQISSLSWDPGIQRFDFYGDA